MDRGVNLEPVREALDSKSMSRGMALMLRVFGVVALVGGLVGSVVLAGVTLDARASSGWPSTPGTIEAVEVKLHATPSSSSGPGAGGRSSGPSHTNRHWEVKIRYRYAVGGATHTGDRASWDGRETYTVKEEAETVAARYRAQPAVKVYYAPDEPSRSVLRPGATTGSELGPYLLLLVAAVGLFLFLDRLRTLRLRVIVALVLAVAGAALEWITLG